MSWFQPFILRPIATSLFAVGLAVVGMITFIFLPVAPLPKIDFPTISVQASLPGASPEIMATSVATPLERQLGRIAGITEMTSSSGLGSTRIIIQFDLSRDIDGAGRDVQAAINAAQGQLPANLPSRPTYRKVNPSDAPIMIIALTSDIFKTDQMYDIAASILQQKLSQTKGAGQVIVGGGSLPAIRVEINPRALNKYGISLGTVGNAIAANNINLEKGQLTQGERLSSIATNDELSKAEQYMPLIIAYHNGAAIRLSDVAEVIESVEDLRNAGSANGKPSILVVLFKQPGANVIDTVDNLYATLPTLKKFIPAGINLDVVLDRTATIRASLLDVETTLILAILLVIGVVYLFLGNVRAALIPSIAVPLSLLGTFSIMYLLDYSLDNLSLMALTIATGFVVDDAIVVLENISRYIEKGMQPLKAAFIGTKEVCFTVLSMSFSLIAVFIPILLMSGIIGRLFREFAVTLSIAILVSLVVSLTITPMMCSKLLTNFKHKETNFSGIRLQLRIQNGYKSSLTWALQHSRVMLFITILILFLTVLLYIFVPKGFFPQQDTGRISASIQTEQDMSFQATKKKLDKFIDTIRQDEAVEDVVGFVGGGSSGSNTGSMFIALKPLKERKISADNIIGRLRKKLSVSGATLYMKTAQDLVIGGRQGNAQFQYTLTANNVKDLNKWTPKVMHAIAQLPGVVDVNSDQRDHGLETFITIDHERASALGLTSQQIDNTLYKAFGQCQISTLFTTLNQYHVVMEVAPVYWQSPEILNEMYIVSTKGKEIPLSAFANFVPMSSLLAVNHQGQFPAATISFNLLPGIPLGEVVDKIDDIVTKMQLPANISSAFRGTAQAFQASLSTQLYLIMAAIVVVYIILGMLYESLIHPITILSTLPTAGVGALLALMLTKNDLTIIAMIGIILLIGIVKKNAIMMIDFALYAERVEKKSSRDAIFAAAVLRFRPIMMTTIAALFSALPLACGTDMGSELRRPLGIAIIGGLILSQMLTLYTTPVIYIWSVF